MSLSRRTGLRTKTGIRPRSDKHSKLIPEHQESRSICVARDGNTCAICGEKDFGVIFEWCHLVSGRERKLSEPMVSWPELTVMAHKRCHVMLDRYMIPERLEELRWQAVSRVLVRIDAEGWEVPQLPFDIPDEEWTAMRALWWLEDALEGQAF